jgi:uncharacterized iron-regulated protein
MTLARTFTTVCIGFLAAVAGCGPASDVRAVESKAQALVATSATTNEVSAAFKRAPIHIYTRAEVRQYRDRTSPADSVRKIWDRMLQYPETHTFPLPGGDIQIFFDDSGRAVGFYSNIQ